MTHSEQGYVTDDGEKAERLRAECQDCRSAEFYQNNESGFRKAEMYAADHVDDGRPCENTRVLAIFPDGSEKRVA